jgi:hypothetical protein
MTSLSVAIVDDRGRDPALCICMMGRKLLSDVRRLSSLAVARIERMLGVSLSLAQASLTAGIRFGVEPFARGILVLGYEFLGPFRHEPIAI